MEWLIEMIQERPILVIRYVGIMIVLISPIIGYFFKHQLPNGTFKNTKKQSYFTLRNQKETIQDCDEVDVRRFLMEMFEDENQFVVLTSPKVKHKVRYIQACLTNGEVEVQIAIEEKNTHLYYKHCTRGECLSIFYDFINNSFKPNMAEYQPVVFM